MKNKRNATPSWSGYLHQGKVGLLLTLINLKELLEKGQPYGEWVIEYESSEDIDIKNGTIVVSRHQVKAYKNAKYPNDYADVLNIQEWDTEGSKVILKQKGFQIGKYDSESGIIEVEVDAESRYLHTITETLGFGLNEEEFISRFQHAKYTSNPNNIKLYVYPDGLNYCDFFSSSQEDKLKKFCISEIENILNILHHSYKEDSYRHKKLYYVLLDSLDNKIRVEHLKSGFPKISFIEILEILKDTKELEEKYISFIRRFFIETWEEFINENKENEKYLLKQEKIEEIIKEIYTLDDENFLQFFRNINPDKTHENEVLTDLEVVKLCDVDCLKDIFYELLFKVEKKFIVDYYGFKEDSGYLLTLINRKLPRIKTLVVDMANNKKLTEGLFNRKYLINDSINTVDVDSSITELKEVYSNNWDRELTRDNIFYLSKMSFIDIESAVEKLNNKEV